MLLRFSGDWFHTRLSPTFGGLPTLAVLDPLPGCAYGFEIGDDVVAPRPLPLPWGGELPLGGGGEDALWTGGGEGALG